MAQNLLCITTAARPSALKAFVWDYIAFCKKHNDYDLLVSLDGDDPATFRFCKRHGIPLLYSHEREGVGLSKNRVLASYPEYSHYFFIEDDVQLLNPSIFDMHISAANELDLHHISSGPRERFSNLTGRAETSVGPVLFFEYGSAALNFFTRTGIEQVGGFHTMFAKFRRFGHTEHSYRFVRSGLARSAFSAIERCFDSYIKVHDPISVTRVDVISTSKRIFVDEQQLIDKELTHFPVTTLSPFERPETLDLTQTRFPFSTAIVALPFHLQMFALNSARRALRLLRRRS